MLSECAVKWQGQPVTESAGSASSALGRRRFLAPLALAQFICSFAGSNMNVMINDITEDLDTTVQSGSRYFTYHCGPRLRSIRKTWPETG